MVLLQTGFTEPTQSPGPLVGSYPTVSPLPNGPTRQAVSSLWHFPPLSGSGRYPASCPVEPGLSSGKPVFASGCPADLSARSKAMLAILSASLLLLLG